MTGHNDPRQRDPASVAMRVGDSTRELPPSLAFPLVARFGAPATLGSADDIAYVEGLRDAGVDGAVDLLTALYNRGVVTLIPTDDEGHR